MLYLLMVILFSDCAASYAAAGGSHGVRLLKGIISKLSPWLLAEFGACRPTGAGPPDAKGFQNITDCFHDIGRIAECSGRAR